MRTSARLVPVTVVVVAILALVSWWSGTTDPEPSSFAAELIPVGGAPSSLSSTWFCAAGSAGTPDTPQHWIVLSNPAESTAEARLSAFGTDGAAGSVEVEVPARSAHPVAVAESFGDGSLSVLVESSESRLAVEHRLVADDAADQVPCATSSSQQWYFPSQATNQVVGDGGRILAHASARLVLFNPFSLDAGVNITAAVEDGIRVPAEWSGIVVPAGSTRVIDLGEEIPRRDQFALTVESRSGRVVAETVQTHMSGAPEAEDRQASGIRMQLGAPGASPRWAFAAGFSGEGVQERIVVQNVNEDTARVVVQVTPVGGAEMAPEPFEIDVPGRRYAVIDVGQESRIPSVGYHSIQVETDGSTPVVVQRVQTLDGGPGDAPEAAEGAAAVVLRPDVDRGATSSIGSPILSSEWLVPLVIVAPGQTPAVVVHNPGRGIATVTMVTLGGGEDGVVLADEVEVPPGDGVVVPLSGSELAGGDVAVEVRSDSPVLVERVVTFVNQHDLSATVAVPYPMEGDIAFVRVGEL